MKKNKIIIPAITLMISAIIIAAIIVSVNNITAPIITKADNATIADALKKAVPTADKFVDKSTDIEANSKIDKIYAAEKDGAIIDYVYIVTTVGYNPGINTMVTIDANGKTIVSDIILSMSETPGFGDKAQKSPDFINQYKGLSALKDVTVVKTGAKAKNNEIDAISGATISSNGITKGVNLANEHFIAHYKK